MTILEKKVDALSRMLVGITDEERRAAQRDLCDLLGKSSDSAVDLEFFVGETLHDIGIPAALTGFQMLADAIMITANDVRFTRNMTKPNGGVYHTIAAKHQSTSSRVERAIRHAIEVAWNRGDVDTLTRYFGNTVDPNKGKPTNREFIARIANYTRQHM